MTVLPLLLTVTGVGVGALAADGLLSIFSTEASVFSKASGRTFSLDLLLADFLDDVERSSLCLFLGEMLVNSPKAGNFRGLPRLRFDSTEDDDDERGGRPRFRVVVWVVGGCFRGRPLGLVFT